MPEINDNQLISMINEFQQLLSAKMNDLKNIRPELIEQKVDRELSQEINTLTGIVNHLVKYKTFKMKLEQQRRK